MSLPRQLSKYKQGHSKTIQIPLNTQFMFFLNNNKNKSFKSADIPATSQGIEFLTMSSLNGPSALQKLVSKRRLAMINMSDNGKIPIQQNYTNVEP